MPSMIAALDLGAEALLARLGVHARAGRRAVGAQAVADAVVAGEVATSTRRARSGSRRRAVRRVRQVHRLDRRAELARELERRRRRPSSTPGSIPSPVSSSGTPRRMPLQVGRRRQRRPARAGRARCESHGSAPTIALKQQRRVGDVARERAGLVERRGEGDHPVAADRAVGRLEADDPAQRGGLADRAAGVGADRPRRGAGGDGGGASRRDEPPGTRVRSHGLSVGP